MIRNIKHYLASEDFLATLDTVWTVFLFLLFIGIVIYVWKMPKEKEDQLKNLPFNDKNE